jgi:hypothetical protein
MDFVTDALRTATAQACQQAGQAPVAAVQNGMIYGASEMARKSPAELVPGFRGAFVGRDDAKCLDLQHKAASRLVRLPRILTCIWPAGTRCIEAGACMHVCTTCLPAAQQIWSDTCLSSHQLLCSTLQIVIGKYGAGHRVDVNES